MQEGNCSILSSLLYFVHDFAQAVNFAGQELFSVSENILIATKTQGMKNNNVQLFRKGYFHAVFYGFWFLLHIAVMTSADCREK